MAANSKKVYLETIGCQMNVSDSERVATKLAAEGYDLVASAAEADVVLFNTCSVRERAEHKLYTRIGEVKNTNTAAQPVVGVLGCVAQLEGETLFEKNPNIDLVIGTRAVGRVGTLLDRVLTQKGQHSDLGERESDYDWVVAPEQQKSPYVAFVPIIEGCNKFCTYCIVPFSRGRERSLPAVRIVEEVRKLRERGIKEVHLIGQNVNSYRPRGLEGLDDYRGATPFARLLRAVAATGIERLKFTTSFPRDFHPDIVNAIEENENLCNWVHLPVQSGSDRMLRSMRRGHTVDSYRRQIERIKASPRRIALTTDLIVGFPGETEADHRDTMRLMREAEYHSVYMFKYSPRPGTPAATHESQVSDADKRRRFVELDALQKKINERILAGYVGRTVSVLAENFSAKTKADLTGHSTSHKVVNFTAAESLLGQTVSVEITAHKVNSLYGKIVSL